MNLTISFSFSLVSNDTQVYDKPQKKENWDYDDNSKEMMKFKILPESTSTKSGEEIGTSSHKQEQFEKEEDSTGEGSDVESPFNKEIKVILTPSTSLSLLIISQSPFYSFQIVS